MMKIVRLKLCQTLAYGLEAIAEIVCIELDTTAAISHRLTAGEFSNPPEIVPWRGTPTRVLGNHYGWELVPGSIVLSILRTGATIMCGGPWEVPLTASNGPVVLSSEGPAHHNRLMPDERHGETLGSGRSSTFEVAGMGS
jgi:hypothetical protein